MKQLVFFFGAAFLLQSCSQPLGKTTENVYSNESSVSVADPDSGLRIDMNQDVSKLSLQDLRLLRTSLYARQGFCIMEADLRGYFSANMPAYDSIMNKRWWSEVEMGSDSELSVQLSEQEKNFLTRIGKAIQARLKENYVTVDGKPLANAGNIVNLFQFESVSPAFLQKLKQNNFVIVPNNNIQMFHVYEKNDYNQVPNFITTDMYLQLFHTYFEYVLKSVEKEKFIPALINLTDKLHNESMKIAASAADPEIKQAAEFSAVFFAVPYELLTGNKKEVPSTQQELFNSELKNIKNETDAESEFLKFKPYYFPYSLFKPRGHYTRTEPLKKYFKAMMWLQTAIMCREHNDQLKKATFLAYLLNSSDNYLQQYKSVFEPIVFLIGEPDNLSVLDICNTLKLNNITRLNQVLLPASINKVNARLVELTRTRNRIKPKVQLSCPDKINFMPQRYLPDNEVLNTMADIKPNAERAYPKGLDVFASFGAGVAEDILKNEEKDQGKWDEFSSSLDSMKNNFTDFRDWNSSVYNKWIESLVALQKTEKNYPSFMQTREWSKKNLNTSLASWSELKHDAILYGEQPAAAECGGGGPPDPICVGYVEPNINFWKKMLELIDLTSKVLEKNKVATENVSSATKELQQNVSFLLSASEKELRKEKLTEQEYKQIEIAGSSVEYLTLSLIDPEAFFASWDDIKGPDKSLAVVADIYTRNITGCNKNGILHVATGYVNDIYVVVEIEGYLYLAKGATFSYHEFVAQERLTDEEWQKMLEEHKAPAIPKWMEEIILQKGPKINEKIFYSSGC